MCVTLIRILQSEVFFFFFSFFFFFFLLSRIRDIGPVRVKKQSKKTKAGSAHNLIKKTKEATGFAERSIYRVLKEKKHLRQGKFESPLKRYHKASRKMVCVDDFDVAAIRRTVHEFYDRKEYPTITKIATVLKQKELFTGG